jgi:hypothetical protein
MRDCLTDFCEHYKPFKRSGVEMVRCDLMNREYESIDDLRKVCPVLGGHGNTAKFDYQKLYKLEPKVKNWQKLHNLREAGQID